MKLANIQDYNPSVVYLDRPHNDEKLILLWLASKTPSSRKTYSYNVHQYLEFVATPIKDTKLEQIINYQNWVKEKYTANTARTKLATVKSLFSFAMKTGYITVNPTRIITTGQGTNAINKRFVEEDVLLDIIRNNRHTKGLKATVLNLLLYKTGLRISEAIKLSWDDFSPCGHGYIISINGKGDTQRFIKIDAPFYDFICELKGDSPYVFTGQKGSHLKRTQGYKLVKDFFDQIPELSPHWLRHCHSIHSLDNGVKIDDLRKSLGHSSLIMTTRYLDARPHQSSSNFIKI